ncbi:MAG TPA: long-chain fatty acid--CoA ligase [Thermoleophilaceae bacterium]|nr:long-chain fatty acid--CoA ligase [Thermoleophilaceae bacterium]
MQSTLKLAPTQEDAIRATRAPTFAHAFQATVERFADELALRTPDDSVQITFAEYAARVRRLAAGLAALGVRRGETIALLLVNRPEFFICDTAALHLGATPFSIYATSSPEQMAYLFENAGNDIVISERAFLPRLREALEAGGGPSRVICVDGPADGTIDLADVEAGADGSDFDFEASWQATRPDDLLTLIYTSGTTGPPKGVELTHENVLAQWRGLAEVLPLRMGGRAVSYLPTAHIADRAMAHYAQMVFGNQLTCVSDPREVVAALPSARPTTWGAVPRVAEKLKAGLEALIAADPDAERRTTVEQAIATGVERVRHEVDGTPIPAELAERHAVAEEKVLRPLRERLGLDAAEIVVFGAAPIPLDVHLFMRAIGLPTAEVYGMSECACVATTYHPSEAKLDTVGRAIPGMELKLADDGEVLLRGPSIMRGYRGDPERTAEAIGPDGWLRTGDVGSLDADGCLRIVDRKKELIINAAGKNMSPALIEGHLKMASPLIGQAMVVGDRRPYNVALLVLEPEAGADPDDPAVREAIAAAVAAANAKLSRVEQIKRWTLLADEWLPDGDELTPTMKLKRKPIAEKYAAEIEALYAD